MQPEGHIIRTLHKATNWGQVIIQPIPGAGKQE